LLLTLNATTTRAREGEDNDNKLLTSTELKRVLHPYLPQAKGAVSSDKKEIFLASAFFNPRAALSGCLRSREKLLPG
jgi:hypothetical protein